MKNRIVCCKLPTFLGKFLKLLLGKLVIRSK